MRRGRSNAVVEIQLSFGLLLRGSASRSFLKRRCSHVNLSYLSIIFVYPFAQSLSHLLIRRVSSRVDLFLFVESLWSEATATYSTTRAWLHELCFAAHRLPCTLMIFGGFPQA